MECSEEKKGAFQEQIFECIEFDAVPQYLFMIFRPYRA